MPDVAQFISAVTLMELEIGALLLKRKNPMQGEKLWVWVRQTVIPGFAGRILAFDAEVSLRCAPLHVPRTPPERDAMIAATALQHRLTVVTRDVRDFEHMGAPLFNPWTDA